MACMIQASAVKYYPKEHESRTGKGILCVSKGESEKQGLSLSLLQQ